MGWTRVFELTYFIGYGASILFYFTLSKLFPPKGLGIQEDLPEDMGFVEGIASHSDEASNELSEAEKGEKAIAVTKSEEVLGRSLD